MISFKQFFNESLASLNQLKDLEIPQGRKGPIGLKGVLGTDAVKPRVQYGRIPTKKITPSTTDKFIDRLPKGLGAIARIGRKKELSLGKIGGFDITAGKGTKNVSPNIKNPVTVNVKPKYQLALKRSF